MVTGWSKAATSSCISGDAQQVGLDDTDTTEVTVDQWVGYRNRYWALMAAPPSAVSARLHTAEDNLDAGSAMIGRGDWSFYLGPVEPKVLSNAAPELSNLLYAGLWFWLRWICFALFHLLAGIHSVIPSWGLAVMAHVPGREHPDDAAEPYRRPLAAAGQ